ncbi:LysR family transcriptional regulator [Microbispora corallina]|uniref:LysR family transcriptional regulator n=1 Tax=Microbispora corallina TaxID=83302 RepID=A0ABQ4G3A9_9ACTN|nr:LysR family transcriptional regulator [Microbispora corallina]GIH41519.1 LysR family transcriptional regulator [Microbispora corallina]
MDSRLLQAFVTVADLGGISPAAEKLGYAQSSLSAQLGRLERELGVALLHRSSSGATPTEAGLTLLPYAREALDLDERMRRAVAGLRPRLRVGAQETLAFHWLPDLLTALDHGAAGRAAAVDVTLTVDTRERLREALSEGRLDLLFLYDNGAPAPGPHAVIGRDRVVLVAAPGHPLAEPGAATPEALAAALFVFAEEGCTSQMLYSHLGSRLDGAAPVESRTVVTGSKAALGRMIAQGRGVGLLPRLAVAADLASGDLVALDVPGPATVAVQAWWRPGLGPVEPSVQALLRLARRHPVGQALS